MKEFREDLSIGLRQIFFVTLPFAAFFAVLALPTIRLIYEHGKVTPGGHRAGRLGSDLLQRRDGFRERQHAAEPRLLQHPEAVATADRRGGQPRPQRRASTCCSTSRWASAASLSPPRWSACSTSSRSCSCSARVSEAWTPESRRGVSSAARSPSSLWAWSRTRCGGASTRSLRHVARVAGALGGAGLRCSAARPTAWRPGPCGCLSCATW